MNRERLRGITLRTNPFAGWSVKIHRVLFVLFLVQLALCGAALWRPFFGSTRWPDGLLIILATATTLASISRHLPGANVMFASLIIAFIGGAVQTLGAFTGVPFGPYVYTANMGQQLFHPLPWAVPMLWVVMILNSRGVARLILRPWRKMRVYGFWLMGLTALLVVLLDLGLEPFATRVKRYWVWGATKGGPTWYTAPWVNFLGWSLTSLLILAFATPWLINKKPVKQPPDYHPLIVWLLINLLFTTGAWVHQLWPAALLNMAACVVVGIFATRGARW